MCTLPILIAEGSNKEEGGGGVENRTDFVNGGLLTI